MRNAIKNNTVEFRERKEYLKQGINKGSMEVM